MTVVVLTCRMLTQWAALGRAAVQVVPMRYRTRVIDMAEDAAASASGYMIGNLLISIFAGLAAFVVLLVLGVPNAIVISLFIAFADLLPLVGATVGPWSRWRPLSSCRAQPASSRWCSLFCTSSSRTAFSR